jgi:hypothetical protein
LISPTISPILAASASLGAVENPSNAEPVRSTLASSFVSARTTTVSDRFDGVVVKAEFRCTLEGFVVVLLLIDPTTRLAARATTGIDAFVTFVAVIIIVRVYPVRFACLCTPSAKGCARLSGGLYSRGFVDRASTVGWMD